MTNPYDIKITPEAYRQIIFLSSKQRRIIIKLAEALAVNLRPPGTKKIAGMIGLYSEEVDQLRLIYKIEDQEIWLLLVKSKPEFKED